MSDQDVPASETPDNVMPIRPSAQPVSALRRVPLTGVPQFAPDAMGLYADAQQVALLLASRFAPYADGTLAAEPTPACVVRLPIEFAESLAKDVLKAIDGVRAQAKAQADALLQAAAKAELEKRLAAKVAEAKNADDAPRGES